MPLQLRVRFDDLRRDLPQPWIRTFLVAAAFAASVLAGGTATFLVSAWHGLPNRDAVRHIGDMDQATLVYDAHDQVAFAIAREHRVEVPLSSVSPALIRAVVAVEDRRFFEHHGFDAVRILSAAFSDIRHRRVVQGGSTITQQLVRQSFLQREKTIRRKVQELFLAVWLEHTYSKTEILELYLNKVYFGDGLYGVEAASLGSLGKHASELSVADAALLAGLVRSPSSDSPAVNLERAIARRNVVLQAMLDAGAIDRPTWQDSRTARVRWRDRLRAHNRQGQYFSEQVRRELVERFGWRRVSQGGLRVFSTIDMPMQIAAEAVVADSLKALDARREALTRRRAPFGRQPSATAADADTGPLQAALVALDPATGHVRAMIGGRDFAESPFNRAVQARRQPGSAFKPVVYAAAIEAGYAPATIIDHLDDPVAMPQGAWSPEGDHVAVSSMSVRNALRLSSNRAAVRVLQQVGIARVVERGQAMGLDGLPSVPSLALGAGEVTLQSLTAAYAAFANHGLVPRPCLIRRVEDPAGHVLYEAQPSGTRAMTDATAFLMATMLADVVNTGTAAGVRRLGFNLPAAGKTGTTNNFNDAWFVGFTPTLATGVWIGFDQPHTILPNGFAADVAVPLWATFMRAATRGDAPAWFRPPAEVTTATICLVSGKLATDRCRARQPTEGESDGGPRPVVYTEYFARGTEPTTYCDRHQGFSLFAAIGRLFGHVKSQPR